MPVLFVTGVPGFLATALLPRLLARRPSARAVCLVESHVIAHASAAIRRIEAAVPATTGRIELVEGDIAAPRLGLGDATWTRDVAEVFHLAAIYDLAVSIGRAMRVNVGGTGRVLAFAAECPRLERLHHVSTCYVSGRHDGVFRESDLACGQSFNNAYEESKYLAEVEVRRHMEGGLPATIYRPSIVVGDSTTGETTKYDGPYVAFRWMLRQGRTAFMPTVGPTDRTRVNVVPRDFVVDAIDYLSSVPTTRGGTYHLADPAPCTVRELLEAFAHVTGQRVIQVPLPHSVARGALRHVPALARWTGIPAEMLDYFVHSSTYDTTHASRALASARLRAPSPPDYLPALVRFMREHPDPAASES